MESKIVRKRMRQILRKSWEERLKKLDGKTDWMEETKRLVIDRESWKKRINS